MAERRRDPRNFKRTMIRGTSDAEFLGEDPVLRSCEVVYDTTNKRLKIGDGVTKYSELGYISTTAYVPPPPPQTYPTKAGTGVQVGVTLTDWVGPMRTDEVTGTSNIVIDGNTFKLIENRRFTQVGGGNFYIPDARTIFRNCEFIATQLTSNTASFVQVASVTDVRFENCTFDVAYNRAVQADVGHASFKNCRFLKIGDSAVEKNNTDGSSDMLVEGCYIETVVGWPVDQHVDGIQWGGGRNLTIRNNTVRIPTGSTPNLSNSCLGLWSEVGNTSGTVLIEKNFLVGGGMAIYLEKKGAYNWQGAVSVLDNVFSREFNANVGYWGKLADSGLPANLTWTGNRFDDGSPLSLADAKI